MISHNFIKQSKAYFQNLSANSFPELREQYKYESLDIDTDIQLLSSRKLWQILKLNQLDHCQLDPAFITQVKQELINRNDFDDGQAWYEAH